MSTPTGVTPLVTDLQLMRDEIVKVAGVPFKRLLVYKLTVPLPLPPEGMALFAIAKGFIIGSITTSLTDQFVNDASYILQDIADGENIGVVVARAGHEGLLPIAVPDAEVRRGVHERDAHRREHAVHRRRTGLGLHGADHPDRPR